MKHIERFANLLTERLGMPCVIEPSRAQSAAHLRLMAGSVSLQEIWQDAGQTTQNFSARCALTISARLTGANEQYRLTHQGMALSVRLSELLREPFHLVGAEETLPDGLMVDGECVIAEARRVGNQLGRLDNDEESEEARLFIWREDWEATLTVRIAKAWDAPAPLNHVLFNADNLPIPPTEIAG